jgi:hypothetical protein
MPHFTLAGIKVSFVLCRDEVNRLVKFHLFQTIICLLPRFRLDWTRGVELFWGRFFVFEVN